MKSELGKYFTVTDNKGNTCEYEILFTFDYEKKSYIVFTDNKLDKDGSVITYAANYKQDKELLVLSDIKNDDEWDIIEGLLSQIENKINEE